MGCSFAEASAIVFRERPALAAISRADITRGAEHPHCFVSDEAGYRR
jgi:hypothetical protein